MDLALVLPAPVMRALVCQSIIFSLCWQTECFKDLEVIFLR